MQLTATKGADGAVILRLNESRLDAAAAIAFKEAVRQAAGPGPGPLVLDLGQVGFLDSSGLGALVAIRKLLGQERGMELHGVLPPVEKVLRLTRLDSIFTVRTAAPGTG